jgi:hypothetical protein
MQNVFPWNTLPVFVINTYEGSKLWNTSTESAGAYLLESIASVFTSVNLAFLAAYFTRKGQSEGQEANETTGKGLLSPPLWPQPS